MSWKHMYKLRGKKLHRRRKYLKLKRKQKVFKQVVSNSNYDNEKRLGECNPTIRSDDY